MKNKKIDIIDIFQLCMAAMMMVFWIIYAVSTKLYNPLVALPCVLFITIKVLPIFLRKEIKAAICFVVIKTIITYVILISTVLCCGASIWNGEVYSHMSWLWIIALIIWVALFISNLILFIMELNCLHLKYKNAKI